jgi:hypothetical protein
VNAETREQSKQWMHTHSPDEPKKFKQKLSARKRMVTVFWGRKEVLMVEFMQQETYNNVINVLRNTKKLRRAIQNKRYGMLTFGVVVLYGSARPHTAARTRALQENFSW